MRPRPACARLANGTHTPQTERVTNLARQTIAERKSNGPKKAAFANTVKRKTVTLTARYRFYITTCKAPLCK